MFPFKAVLICLIVFSFSIQAKAQKYHYSSINVRTDGGDCFAISRSYLQKTTGNIYLHGTTLQIDKKIYRLKYTKDIAVFKSKGFKFHLIYENGILTYVEQDKFSSHYRYYVGDNYKNAGVATSKG